MSVTIEDIAIALGRAEDVPAAGGSVGRQWSMWMEDARMLIRARLGDLDALDQESLDYVVREAVVAQIRRPDDATSVEVAVDDGRVARRYSSSRGRVTIRDEWWTLLNPDSGKGGAFSLDMAGACGSIHQPWCSLAFGALYCSCGADIAGFPLYEA